MKRNWIILTLVLICSTNLFSKNVLKTVQLNWIFSDSKFNYNYPTTNYSNYQIGITNFVPSISLFKNNKNFTEIGIQNFVINHSNNSVTNYGNNLIIASVSHNSNIQLKFYVEKNIRLLKKKDSWKLQPYLGFSFNPFISYLKLMPLSSNNFIVSTRNAGVDINFIPKVLYNINSNFFLNISIPLTVMNFTFYNTLIHNPTQTKSENTSSGFDFDMLFNKAFFKIGLGYKFK